MFTRLYVIGLTAIAALLTSVLLAGPLAPARPAGAALQEGDFRPQVLIGRDDDELGNPAIQIPGSFGNQSMDSADILIGDNANDVLVGRNGGDRLLGGQGSDILIGGPEFTSLPAGDLLLGEAGDDVAVWRPGDNNVAFLGGPGRDAFVLGKVDLAEDDAPTLTGRARGFPHGIPTADVRGLDGSCRLERVPAASTLGYEWIAHLLVTARIEVEGRVEEVEFFGTARLAEVEQVFCPGPRSVHGLGQVLYADLTHPEPGFVPVGAAQVRQLNPLVGGVVR